MLTPFKCLKFVESFATTHSSHPLVIYAQTSFKITLGISENVPKNRFEDMKLTANGSYSMRMFHSRRLNKKINSIHGRALRITYQDHISTFQGLLNKDNSVSIHHRNLQALTTEMFNIHRGLSPEILREIFVPKISLHDLRRNNTFERPQVHSVYHGTEALSFLGPTIWDFVPLELK